MATNEHVSLGITFGFYVLGICTLLPWNFFITADQFWQYKLRNTSYEVNWTDAPLTDLQISFLPTLGALTNVINLVFAFATSISVIGVGDKMRIYAGLWISLISMFVVTSLAFFNTDDWQEIFFGLSQALMATLSVGVAVLQTSLYGLASQFPSLCITALFSGQAISGVVSSVSILISLSIGQADPVVTGIIYFLIADVFIIASLLSFYYIQRSESYRTVKMSQEHGTKIVERIKFQSYLPVMKKIGWTCFTTAFCLCVTLMIFPAVQVYISSTMEPSLWTTAYFQPTITFLLYNLFDVIGREACRFIQWPNSDGWLLHVTAGSRVILIPLIMLCHGNNKGFATLFYNDAFYAIFNIILAFTNGYVLSLCMIYYKRFVKPHEVELGGTIMGCMMAIGLAIGSWLSPLLVAIWQPKE